MCPTALILTPARMLPKNIEAQLNHKIHWQRVLYHLELLAKTFDKTTSSKSCCLRSSQFTFTAHRSTAMIWQLPILTESTTLNYSWLVARHYTTGPVFYRVPVQEAWPAPCPDNTESSRHVFEAVPLLTCFKAHPTYPHAPQENFCSVLPIMCRNQRFSLGPGAGTRFLQLRWHFEAIVEATMPWPLKHRLLCLMSWVYKRTLRPSLSATNPCKVRHNPEGRREHPIHV